MTRCLCTIGTTMLARVDTPLKRALAASGRSQIWLAREIDSDPSQVNRWVHGLHAPAPATQAAIAEALDCTVESLWATGIGEAA